MSRQRGTQTTQTNGQLVKGLRRRPLTAKTRVRFPYWLLRNSENLTRVSTLVIFFIITWHYGWYIRRICLQELLQHLRLSGFRGSRYGIYDNYIYDIYAAGNDSILYVSCKKVSVDRIAGCQLCFLFMGKLEICCFSFIYYIYSLFCSTYYV